jgi:phosphatidylserine/phosphatidylglycerophosphate/cardiolipin synthase-like enzyme
MSKRAGSAVHVMAVIPRDRLLTFSLPAVPGTIAEFSITLQGVYSGEVLKIEFWEIDNPNKEKPRPDRLLGSVSGAAVPLEGPSFTGGDFIHQGTIDVGDARPAVPTVADGQPVPAVVAFRFDPKKDSYYYALSQDLTHQFEGDGWGIQVRVPDLELQSTTLPVAHVRREVERAFATYRSNEGNLLQLFHDGSTDLAGSDGAFKQLWEALDKADKFIFITDWSFYPLFRPIGNRQQGGAGTQASLADSIGMKLVNWAKAKSDRVVAVLAWKQFPDDPLNNSARDMFDSLSGGTRPPNILFRASAHTKEKSTYTHHQKFVAMDQPPDASGRRPIKVFFGGLDLTKGRFDCPQHPILAKEDHCQGYLQVEQTPDYEAERYVPGDGEAPAYVIPQKGYKIDDWYNCEFDNDTKLPREPWHDIYGSVTGAAGWDFFREFVGRWGCDPGWWSQGDTDSKSIEMVDKVFRDAFKSDSQMKQQWEWTDGSAGPWVSQVYRSIRRDHWDHSGKHQLGVEESIPSQTPQSAIRATGHKIELQWSLSEGYEHSIQNAYRQAIRQADNFIYIENQYVIGSGAHWAKNPERQIENEIPWEIVQRIKDRRKNNVPFHVYIVSPMYPEGSPVDVKLVPVRYYEWKTMEWMIQQLGDDWEDSLSFYFLANWHHVALPVDSGDRKTRVSANMRYMVYVHSKFMLVDDRYTIFGSANLNERSQNGNRDSEIACGFWPRVGHEKDCETFLKTFRKELWQEHLGAALPGSWDSPGSTSCSDAIQRQSRINYDRLRACATKGKVGQLCLVPVILDMKSKALTTRVERSSIDNSWLLPDAEGPADDPTSPAVSTFWGWNPTGAKWYQWKSMAGGTIKNIGTGTQ